MPADKDRRIIGSHFFTSQGEIIKSAQGTIPRTLFYRDKTTKRLIKFPYLKLKVNKFRRFRRIFEEDSTAV